jgi:hypothetical protein
VLPMPRLWRDAGTKNRCPPEVLKRKTMPPASSPVRGQAVDKGIRDPAIHLRNSCPECCLHFKTLHQAGALQCRHASSASLFSLPHAGV